MASRIRHGLLVTAALAAVGVGGMGDVRAQTQKIPLLTSLGLSYTEIKRNGAFYTNAPFTPLFDSSVNNYAVILPNNGKVILMSASWDSSENVVTDITINGMSPSGRGSGLATHSLDVEVGVTEITWSLLGGTGNTYTLDVIRRREGVVLDLDVDDSGMVTPADGILIARYLLGVEEGMGLTAGQTVSDDRVVAALVSNGGLDVDERTGVDYHDGILIARYLLGFRGDVLGAGMVSAEPQKVAEKIQRLLRQP